VAQAQTSARNAQYNVRAQELQLQTDVATALRNLETAFRTSEIQERVRATAAEELRLAQERFRFGAASSVEVTDAQTNLAEAERAQIEAVYNFHQSLAALEALVGEPLR
jgi:outer membrane protein